MSLIFHHYPFILFDTVLLTMIVAHHLPLYPIARLKIVENVYSRLTHRGTVRNAILLLYANVYLLVWSGFGYFVSDQTGSQF